MNKSLVCYFSITGTTQKVAEKIKEVLNWDLFEIKPIDEYTSEDLDWTNENSRSSKEMKNNIKPSVRDKVNNIEDYEVVILGFPVWWYKEPTIIDAFIDENNLEGKKVYVFVTSAESSVDGSFESLKEKYSNINFVSGKRLTSTLSDDDVLNWIRR